MPKTRKKYLIDELLSELEELNKKKVSATKLKNQIDKIGNLGDKKAFDHVLPFLNHETDYVRASATQALAKIRGKNLARVLIDKFQEEKSTLVQQIIIETLGVLGDEEALPLLKKVKASKTYSDKTIISAIFSIDRLTRGNISAIKQLVDYLIDSRNPKIRVEAAKLLGKLGDPAAIKYLIAALDDEKIYVRKFVIKALVSFRDKRVVDPIINTFIDESHFIDREFISVLWEFPEYAGKELWEIIELRNREKMEELEIPDAIEDTGESTKGINPETSLQDAYQYELVLASREKRDRESHDKPAEREDKVSSINTEEEMRELTDDYEFEEDEADSRSLAKEESIPEIKENVDEEDGKQDLLQTFSENFTTGEKYYRKKRYYEALIHFKKSLEIKYDAWQAWYNMGLIFYDVDEIEKSISCFQNTLRYKPNEIDALLNLGSIYFELHKNEKGIFYLVHALKQSSYLSDAWLLLGKILKKLGHHKFALFCFNQVLKFSRDKKERKQARNFNQEILTENSNIKPKDPREVPLPSDPEEDFKLNL